MEESREILRAVLFEVVEKQIQDGNPIATRQTFERLKRQGHTADEAKRLIAAVVAAETFGIAKHGRPYDESMFVERLQQLPDLSWSEDPNA